MKRVSQFYKVSYEQFLKDYREVNKNSILTDEEVKTLYEGIKLPARATKNSAGYDFYLPYEISMKPGETLTIPTGVRASMRADWALILMPKSGLGFKHRLILNNTLGLIDADYYYSDNEGHIHAKLLYDTHESKDTLSLPAGKSFIQGVFVPFGITKDDKAVGVRNGGFGSTK